MTAAEDPKALCINAFVMGAEWARFQITGFTAFASERDEAEQVARERYPYVPRLFQILAKDQEDTIKALRAELAQCSRCAMCDEVKP